MTRFFANRSWSALAALLLGTALLCGSAALLGESPQPNATPGDALSGQQVLDFLHQTIAWYRDFTLQQQLATEPRDVMFVNNNRQLAEQVVRLSFDFAKAEANALSNTPPPEAQLAEGEESHYQSLRSMTERLDQQVKQTQDEIDGLKRKLQTATGRRRADIESTIAETQSELQLAQARRDALRGMTDFVGSATGLKGTGSLQSQIDELQQVVPATAVNNKPGATEPAAIPAIRRPEPTGILGLISDVRMLSHTLHELDGDIASTDALAGAAKNLRAPMRANLRNLVRQGDVLAKQADSADPATLAQEKRQLDAITTQFKAIAQAAMPLSKQSVLLDLYKRNLMSWRTGVQAQYSADLRGLILRLVALGVMVAVVLGVSELWRRAIFRYVQDVRRRYQFLLLRRVVTWCVVAIIIAFAFATELGSLATFAGLLTAGVAVALQNVILSIAGYFFLIGKFGVRVGDRVQIAGVTGEVVDIGLVRLHVMELGGNGPDAQATGRIVAFSNSVVFQSTGGLFKQIPGTNFVWHEIKLTLAPETDYRRVEERLVGAVEAVFATHRDRMEQQQRHMARTLSPLQVSTLKPQSRLHLTPSGLEVVIRYPLELDSAAELDDRITRELLDAMEREPKLRLVGSGTPTVQPAADSMSNTYEQR